MEFQWVLDHQTKREPTNYAKPARSRKLLGASEDLGASSVASVPTTRLGVLDTPAVADACRPL